MFISYQSRSQFGATTPSPKPKTAEPKLPLSPDEARQLAAKTNAPKKMRQSKGRTPNSTNASGKSTRGELIDWKSADGKVLDQMG